MNLGLVPQWSNKRRRVTKKSTVEETMESSLSTAGNVDQATSTIVYKGQSLNSILVEDIKDGELSYKVLSDNKILSVMSKFSGKIVDYHAFKFDYKAIVWDSSLPEYHKVKVLKNCLKDVSELEFIQYKPNDMKTIEKAFEFMDKMYKSEFRNFLDESFRQQNDVEEYDLENLRTLHSAFIKTVSICKHFGMLEYYKYEILKAIMSKLPYEMKYEILEKEGNLQPGLEDLENFLEHKLWLFKMILEEESYLKVSKKRDYDEAFDEASNEALKAKVRFCKFDGERHLYSDCKLSHQRRMEIVRERRLCRSCLGEKHIAKECKYPHTCDKCNEGHHYYLCPDIPINSTP